MWAVWFSPGVGCVVFPCWCAWVFLFGGPPAWCAGGFYLVVRFQRCWSPAWCAGDFYLVVRSPRLRGSAVRSVTGVPGARAFPFTRGCGGGVPAGDGGFLVWLGTPWWRCPRARSSFPLPVAGPSVPTEAGRNVRAPHGIHLRKGSVTENTEGG